MSNLHLDGVKKHLGIIGEFKEFAMRGNVVDLAIGVIIGGAFGKIVSSMVGDILMPVIGWGTPVGGDLKDKFYSLEPAKTAAAKTLAEAQKAGAVIAWGQFVTTVIDFIIVAFFIFLVVKLMNKMKTPPPPPPAPETPPQEKLLAEIRDLLKARS
jgi:large conductance mechanosensitive channel